LRKKDSSRDERVRPRTLSEMSCVTGLLSLLLLFDLSLAWFLYPMDTISLNGTLAFWSQEDTKVLFGFDGVVTTESTRIEFSRLPNLNRSLAHLSWTGNVHRATSRHYVVDHYWETAVVSGETMVRHCGIVRSVGGPSVATLNYVNLDCYFENPIQCTIFRNNPLRLTSQFSKEVHYGSPFGMEVYGPVFTGAQIDVSIEADIQVRVESGVNKKSPIKIVVQKLCSWD